MPNEIDGWEYTDIRLESASVLAWGESFAESGRYDKNARLFCVIARDSILQYEDPASRLFSPLSVILNEYGNDGWELVQLVTRFDFSTFGANLDLSQSSSGYYICGLDLGSFNGETILIGALFKRPRIKKPDGIVVD